MTSLGTLSSWITLDGLPGDIAELQPKLKTYAEIAQHWMDIANAIRKLGTQAPVDSPVKLAVYLASAIDDQAIVDIFTELKLDNLYGEISKIASDFADESPPWAELLKPMSAFVPTGTTAAGADGFGFDDGNKIGLLDLKIPKLAGNAAGNAGPAALSFDISAQGGLACAAGAIWPFQGDAVKPGLLRIGANGKVQTKAGFSLPFGQFGKGTANAGATAEAAIGFFFRPKNMAQPFAEVLFDALTSIPAPLDLDDISHAVNLSGLEGMVLGCDGAVDTGLGLVLGESYNLPNIASGTVGLVAELSFKRNARWILSLRRVDEGMRFVLSRDDASEKKWGVGVDVKLDATPLTRRVHDLLLKADDATKPILAQIKPFLSPGTYIATQAQVLLKTTVESIVGDQGIRDALTSDLSLALGEISGNDRALISLLEDKIADLAATQSKGLLAKADDWVAMIVDGLVAQVPALAAPGIAAKLTAKIKPLLVDVQQKFEALVAGLTANPTLSTALAQELAAVGAKVKATETKADKLLAAVREVVEKFDDFAEKVLDATGDSANAKIAGRFAWSGNNASAQKYELIGAFAKDAPADSAALRQDLWRDLVTGRAQRFQKILANPSLAPAGFALSPQSSLSRFASAERGFAFEIVILGVDLSITSIVTGKASITSNLAGDVIVTSEGSALRKVEGFGEGRSASFVNSWDLMLAKLGSGSGDKRAMSVGIGFDHNDQNLSAGEVKKLLAGLEKQKLIDGARVTAAVTLYQKWQIDNALDPDVRGNISLRMTLPAEAVQRMVAIGRELNKPGNAALLAVFGLAVRAQLACGVTNMKQFDRDIASAKDMFTISISSTDPVAYMVALWNSNIALLPSNQGENLPALAQVIPRAGSFVKMLRLMARIYDAIPISGDVNVGDWTEKDYAAAEKDLAAAARSWLRLNQKFIFFFKAELHPAMLAFLRLLALMASPASPGNAIIDGFDADPDTAVSNGLFLIGMSQGAGRAATPI